MRGAGLCETLLSKIVPGRRCAPLSAASPSGLLALQTPQVLSSGHGALHFNGIVTMPLAFIGMVFVLKTIGVHDLARVAAFAAACFSPRFFWARSAAVCSPRALTASGRACVLNPTSTPSSA